MCIPPGICEAEEEEEKEHFPFRCVFHLECDLNMDSIWNLPVRRRIFSNSSVDSILDSASDVESSTWYLFHMLITAWNLLVES
jgi:hypothetical protein